MLKLRKLLLCNTLYYGILLLAILYVIFSCIKPYHTNYSVTSTSLSGTILSITEKENSTTYIVKGKEKVLVTIKKKNLFQLGDQVRVEGEFQVPNKNKTKYFFNYQDYLKHKKIFFLVDAKTITLIRKNKRIFYWIKQQIVNYINKDPYQSTFILGDKSYLSQEIIRSYQENGISHLFALSGMHITLLSGMMEKVLKRFLKEEKIFFYTSLFLIIYLFLVGLSPSIVRGALFYILFKGNNIYYFYIKKENLFLLTISISLFINPFYIQEEGFQYSYLISYSLLKMSNYLSSDNKIIGLLKVSTISFIASIPITLKSFYQINLLSIIYNLFFVPYISVILFPTTLIVFFIKPLSPIYNVFIIVLEEISMFFSKISFGKIVFKRLPIVIYIVYLLSVLLFLNTKKKYWIYGLLFFLTIHFLIPKIDVTNYVKVIDVDQGDSILIHMNHKNILIDTGGKESKRNSIFYNSLSPTLKMEGIQNMDYLILSHGDYDHMGESINLVNNFKVKKVIFNCGPHNDLESELIKVLEKKKINYYSCIKELNIDKNNLYFLQTKEYDNENDNSNVIYTELDGYKFMFMGDASSITEKEIMSIYNLPDIDVLKVGHHGSKTSSSKEFINEINPKYSIISVGKNNRYGHPNKEILNNLKEAKIYRTDIDGNIMFKIKNNRLKIETCSS